jgi:hypothetical protein
MSQENYSTVLISNTDLEKLRDYQEKHGTTVLSSVPCQPTISPVCTENNDALKDIRDIQNELSQLRKDHEELKKGYWNLVETVRLLTTTLMK